MIGIVMMIAGGILLVSGYFVFANKEKNLSHIEEMEGLIQAVTADGVFTEKEKVLISQAADKHNIDKAEVFEKIEERLSNAEDEAEAEIIDQASKNGYDFEKYIVRKFSKKRFTIKKWAGDKYVEGIYSEENQYPDIVVEFQYESYKRPLAIECKWRREYNNGSIKFSYDAQLKRYKQFAKEYKTTVYIALGVGGKALAPDELYLIPLKDLQEPTISSKDLTKYKKNPDDAFYYDMKAKTLNISPYPKK